MSACRPISTTSTTATATAALPALALVLPALAVLVIPRDDGLDLRRAALDQDGVAADVLALHLAGGLEELVAVAEADEAEAFALGGALVANDARFLHRGPAGEGLEEGLVRHLAREVADEDAEVGGVPFEK